MAIVLAALVTVLAAGYSFVQAPTLVQAARDMRAGDAEMAHHDYVTAAATLADAHRSVPTSRKITIGLAEADFGAGKPDAAMRLLRGMRLSPSDGRRSPRPCPPDTSSTSAGEIEVVRRCPFSRMADRPVDVPRVIVHEAAHRFFCDVTDTHPRLYDVATSAPSPTRPVRWCNDPPTLRAALLISAGPLVINTLLCSILTLSVAYEVIVLDAGLRIPVLIVLASLGYSIGMHEFPSRQGCRQLHRAGEAATATG